MADHGQTTLLEVIDLTIWRGENLLLDEVSFQIQPRSILQIQGANGSGKTTLLRAMICLAEYDEGEILWRGKPLLAAREDLYNELLYLGHKPGISPGLTPWENLKSLCPELGTQGREQVSAILAELSIDDRIDLPSAALSAGQKRRISLARLRLQSATLWVLDEPLTSLDAEGFSWVKKQIEHHVLNGGSVVFTTHQSLIFDGVNVETLVLGDAGE